MVKCGQMFIWLDILSTSHGWHFLILITQQYSNVWRCDLNMHLKFQSFTYMQTDCIARVSPNDGQVIGWIFLHELKYVAPHKPKRAVLFRFHFSELYFY